MLRTKNKTARSKTGITLTVICIMNTFFITGCTSKYKSTWDCPKEKGIGCSSIEFADSVAKEEIMLNIHRENKTLLINQDTLGGFKHTQIEVN